MGRDSRAWRDEDRCCRCGYLFSRWGVLDVRPNVLGGGADERHGQVRSDRCRSLGELRITGLSGHICRRKGAVDERLGGYNRRQRGWASCGGQPGISGRHDHDSDAIHRASGAEADTGRTVAAGRRRGNRGSGLDWVAGGSRLCQLQETARSAAARGLEGLLAPALDRPPVSGIRRGTPVPAGEIRGGVFAQLQKRVALSGLEGRRFRLPRTVLLLGLPRQVYASSGGIHLQPCQSDRARALSHAVNLVSPVARAMRSSPPIRPAKHTSVPTHYRLLWRRPFVNRLK